MPQAPDLPQIPDAAWLSAKQIAADFGVNEDTVLRWWHQGLPTGKDIPDHFVKRRGFKGWLFRPEVVEFIRAEQSQAC
jgi:transposase